MNIQQGKLENYKPIKFIKNKYIISWGLEKIDENQYKWYYFILNNKPSINDIKKTINNYVNNVTKNNIENYFYWNDMHIKLTIEDQMDYKLLFDVTMLQDGANLPEKIKFKVNNENIYYEIDSIEEFKDFIIKMTNHIRKCVNNSRNIKESVDYSKFIL